MNADTLTTLESAWRTFRLSTALVPGRKKGGFMHDSTNPQGPALRHIRLGRHRSDGEVVADGAPRHLFGLRCTRYVSVEVLQSNVRMKSPLLLLRSFTLEGEDCNIVTSYYITSYAQGNIPRGIPGIIWSPHMHIQSRQVSSVPHVTCRSRGCPRAAPAIDVARGQLMILRFLRL